MSLSNPNKVVTEERLNEYHQTILPYLGGMPDILANKFSRADLFSTDEKMIGRWIDGKPLYQKTVTFDNPHSEAVGSYKLYTLIEADENMSSVMFVNGVVYDSTDNRWYSLPFDRLYSATDKIIPELFVSAVNEKTFLRLSIPSSSSYQISKVIVTLQYTKTTDSTVDIGLDTDYSTDEKIIGTWIDGKRLYQKTLTFDPTVTIPQGAWTDLADISALSAEKIVYASVHAGNGQSFPSIINTENNKLRGFSYVGSFGSIEAITIQYTKTTD